MPSFLRRLIAIPSARPIATNETISLRLPGGVEVSVLRVRHSRARRIKLSVSEGGVRLTLPMRASLRAADAFLLEHLDWIAKQLPRWKASEDAVPFGRHTETIPLRGEDIPLRWESGRYAHARRDEHGVVIALPAATPASTKSGAPANDAPARRTLKEFYLAEARADIGRWLPKYLPTLPRAPTTIRVRPLSSLWGSLSARDALSLDLALALGKPAAFEYVLVHELCHLLQRNHKRAFWSEVEARGADWRAQRDYLHDQGAALKANLRRLIDPK
ncbi:MAG TPA: SprT family zinc-dependent metalloprotease [Xanthomonadaceae bacterium]|jgi:predicted metal-dependent hydrolase|nr:SprT family zinc-dependent metalloprotease [Xanthomonadaceae bacterium]